MSNLKTQQHIYAVHEIGHAIVAASFGFKITKIDVTDIKIPHVAINYNEFQSLANKLNKLQLPSDNKDSTGEFIFKYIHVFLSGDICEELYKLDFNTSIIHTTAHSADTDIVNHCCKIFDLNDSERNEIIQSVLDVCISHKDGVYKLLGLLETHGWVLYQPSMTSFLVTL